MICLYEEGACYEDNYIWNEAGALTERSGDLSGTTIVFVYNVAGFPRSINGKDYVYLSDGTKVKMLGADGKGLLYRGNFVYHTHPPQYGHPLLESIGHREGRFVVTGKTGDDTPDLQDLYFVRDHLGSVVSILERGDDSSFDISDIREENLYHSYGTLHRGNGIPGMSSNRYRYNGKEEQPVGTDYIDYGARLYSPGLGRWLSPDPLAEKYYNVSPYAFCNNNPVNFVDPDGRFPDVLWDIASIGMGVRSFVQNIKSGNVSGAVGDAVGIAIDAVAAAVPFVPGGVGAVRASAKAVNAIDNAADAAKTARTGELADVVKTMGDMSETSKVTHGNSRMSTKSQHAYDIIDSETGNVVKTGVSGGKVRGDGKSYRAEQQVRKWNAEAERSKYESVITHTEPEGVGARDRILDYEKRRADYLRQHNQLDKNRHIRS